tara:strand:- start:39 stop:428 length:390 start_codon:yes stop_codon:yes gene_type:complete
MNENRYKSSAFGAFVGFVGIISIILIMGLMSLIPGCDKFNTEVTETLKNDPRPKNHLSNYLPPSFYLELDTISNNLDSLDNRLDSLLKLESIIDSMIEAIDTVWADCTHSIYPDEHVMWITGDGDTIWE